MAKIIGLSGKKGSGKDTIYSWLHDRAYASGLFPLWRVSFAEPIKRICIDYLGADPLCCFGEDARKETLVPGLSISHRQLMQEVGMGLRRMDDKVFTRLAIAACKSPGYAVITDVRFPDEVAAIKQAGGRVIRLLRSKSQDAHISETALDDYTGFDAVIDNRNQTVEQTGREALAHILSWREE